MEDEPLWSEGALREHLRQLAEPTARVDSVQAVRRTLYAARQMEAAGLMPARDPSFLVAMGASGLLAARATAVNPARAHVLGYVTGRNPSHYDELVLVAADLDSAGAAAALEVARVLAQQALDTQVPERTVLFALWAPPRTGALGLRDYLANPTWALQNIRRVLLVTADTAAAAESGRLLEKRGIAFEVVTPADHEVTSEGLRPASERARTLARTERLAEALFARIRAAAVGPFIADSLAADSLAIDLPIE